MSNASNQQWINGEPSCDIETRHVMRDQLDDAEDRERRPSGHQEVQPQMKASWVDMPPCAMVLVVHH